MDEIKNLTDKNSLQQLSTVLNKLVKAIRANKAQVAGVKSKSSVRHETAICKETEYLKLQCLSDNRQLSQLAFQSFVRLVEEGSLDPGI